MNYIRQMLILVLMSLLGLSIQAARCRKRIVIPRFCDRQHYYLRNFPFYDPAFPRPYPFIYVWQPPDFAYGYPFNYYPQPIVASGFGVGL